MPQSSIRSSQPASEVTASASSSAPCSCAMREISSSGWRAPVLVSPWTMATTLTWPASLSAASTCSGSMIAAPGRLDGHDGRAAALDHLRHAHAEVAVAADDDGVAGLDDVVDGGLHAGGAGAGDRHREVVLGAEDRAQGALRVVEQLDEDGVEHADDGLRHRAVDARVHERGPGAEQEAVGEVEFAEVVSHWRSMLAMIR